MSIKSAMDDVESFHVAAGVPVRDKTIERPVNPTYMADVELREDLIREEYREVSLALDDAVFAASEKEHKAAMVAVADGLADLIYVCIGTALTLGIPLDRVWKEVHRSNMAKVEGGVRKNDAGKVLKPEGWTPPDIHECLYGEEQKPSRGVYGWPRIPG